MSAPNKNYDPVEVTALTAEEVERAAQAALAAIAGAQTLDELKEARLAHAGDKAPLSLARAEIGALPPQARADAGRRVGAATAQVRDALKQRQEQLERERDEQVLITERVDVTLPYDRAPQGARHPVSHDRRQALRRVRRDGLRGRRGARGRGRVVQLRRAQHPAGPPGQGDAGHPVRRAARRRAAWAPRSGMVLRTHTSPVQIRTLLTRPLPLYVVSPGKVYRNEALDATHLPVFYQIEGLAVDEGLTMADLRGAIQAFVDALFGAGLRTRLRPDYFPFTEPSADVSMECHVCRGESTKPGADPCRVCRSQGWIEIAGCGMVNPRVLVACGIDPDRYSGFAFGLGIERALMLAHGINEIRDTYDGDVRFSRAFGTEI